MFVFIEKKRKKKECMLTFNFASRHFMQAFATWALRVFGGGWVFLFSSISGTRVIEFFVFNLEINRIINNKIIKGWCGD